MNTERTMKHWTQESANDFAYSIALDFFTQLQDRLSQSPMKNKSFAQKLGVSRGRVSQLLNDPPDNPKLVSLVKYARALGMKVSLVAYDDGDPENSKGPIFSEIFSKCWEKLGCPRDMRRLRTDLELSPAYEASEAIQYNLEYQTASKSGGEMPTCQS